MPIPEFVVGNCIGDGAKGRGWADPAVTCGMIGPGVAAGLGLTCGIGDGAVVGVEALLEGAGRTTGGAGGESVFTGCFGVGGAGAVGVGGVCVLVGGVGALAGGVTDFVGGVTRAAG
jgi:hypothetical protein